MAKDVNDSSRFSSLSDKDRAKQITKDRRQPIRDSSLKVTHTLLNIQWLTLTSVCFLLLCRSLIRLTATVQLHTLPLSNLFVLLQGRGINDRRRAGIKLSSSDRYLSFF